MPSPDPSIHGRGAAANPKNRFVPLEVLPDHDHASPDDDAPSPTTNFFREPARSAITYNDSPDIPFTASLNPYRGCEHGCIYCYARPTHEYLGFSAGLDFETKILVKHDAPTLLRKELSSKSWQPQVLSLGGVTDPYQPGERQFQITRQCLQVLHDFRNPAAIVTKSALVLRDLDLLTAMSQWTGIAVYISVTTLDPALHAKLEPRGASPSRRLDAIRQLAAANIPVGVMVAPVIPGLTDTEVPSILKEAYSAGARSAGTVPLRLPGAVAPLFEDWLTRHYPDRKNKVLNLVRSLRAGRLNDPNFNSRMQGTGQWADQLRTLFDLGCRRAGFPDDPGPGLSAAHFRVPPKDGQLPLFE